MSLAQEKSTLSIEVAEFINAQPVGGYQIKLLATCAAVLFLDGFDTQAIG
jgi:AAHS family 4-hydroxybenzoate transporter-like MFS transporter